MGENCATPEINVHCRAETVARTRVFARHDNAIGTQQRRDANHTRAVRLRVQRFKSKRLAYCTVCNDHNQPMRARVSVCSFGFWLCLVGQAHILIISCLG